MASLLIRVPSTFAPRAVSYLGNVGAVKNFDDKGAVDGFKMVPVRPSSVLFEIGRNCDDGCMHGTGATDAREFVQLLLSNRSDASIASAGCWGWVEFNKLL